MPNDRQPPPTAYAPETLLAARHMIRAHGKNALNRALRHSDDLLISSSIDAAEMWLEIARAIRSIESGEIEN